MNGVYLKAMVPPLINGIKELGSGHFMADRKRTHEFRDPIHTFIKADNRERQIIASAPFQRLRNIHQLALTYMVYPGETHRRFEHSLGVMDLAGRVFDVITNPEKHPLRLGKSILPDRNDLRIGDVRSGPPPCATTSDICLFPMRPRTRTRRDGNLRRQKSPDASPAAHAAELNRLKPHIDLMYSSRCRSRSGSAKNSLSGSIASS